MKCPRCANVDEFCEDFIAKVTCLHINIGTKEEPELEVQEQRVEEIIKAGSITCNNCNYKGGVNKF